jgi:Spy/CpxP family protein refolding chaperone
LSAGTKIVMSMAFALALCAGTAVGLLGSHYLPQARPDRRSWLTDELNLTPQQADQMKQIWSDIGKSRDEFGDRRRAMEKERNEKFQALLTDQQRTSYDAIAQTYSQQMQDLGREREARFQEAQKTIEAILTPEQREKYKTIMQRRHENHGGGQGGPEGHEHGGPGPGGHHGGGGGGPGMPFGAPPPTEPSSRPSAP